ncbi:hypothetical protein CVT91_01475 [Candidatus Atribacteria bacterium HGW-Atribacteria-1]|nr:MAG: hypothetical protein CVT91_01475 [Candidatus Atribacteria bacterium HGW-Atribacteria-1]
MKKILFIILSILIIGSTFYIGVVTAQEQYILKYSHTDAADPFVGGASPAYAVSLKAEVERLSGGKIKVEIYPGGQLGDSRSIAEQIRKGTVEASNIGSGLLASLYFEKMNIFDMPFSFSSKEVARRVLDINRPFTRKLVEECAEKTGIRILGLMPYGLRYLTNNIRPVHSPDDMKGLKIRTMEIVPHMELIKSLGAIPTPIPWLELYTSLQTKVVDGMECPFYLIASQKFYQVQKYLTTTGHIMGIAADIISEKFFQSLPDDLKVALIEGVRVAQDAFIGFGTVMDSTGLKEIEASGTEVYTLTPEEMAMFKEKTVPAVRKWMEKQLGADFITEYLAVIKAAEDELRAEVKSLK